VTHPGQRGFTLVEAVIGMLILGLILIAWMSLEVFTARTVRKVSDFSTGQKIMLTVMNDVLTAERGLPAFSVAADSAFNKPVLLRAELETEFQSFANKKTVCYDRNGVLSTVPNCNYFVSYFKYRTRDRSFPKSELENVPLARVVVQIRFLDRENANNEDSDRTNDVYVTRYMTRLVSNVADF
jgi:hypothetical protein